MPTPKFHTRFNPPRHEGFSQPGEESMTRQSEMDGCDINVILDRYNNSGKLPLMESRTPIYIDSTGADFQRSLDIVRDAQEAFSSLPGKTRQYFNHNPAEFLAFFENPDNAKKAYELGLAFPSEPTEKQLLTELVKNTTKVVDKGGNSADT